MNAEYQKLCQWLKPDNRYWLEERAAIREYDGEMSREDAEREAVKDFQKHIALQNSVKHGKTACNSVKQC